MELHLKKIEIGTGIYLPEKTLTNEELEKRNILLSNGKMLKADRILEKIGVSRRHIAEKGETVADMGSKAAREALGAPTKPLLTSSYQGRNNKVGVDLVLVSTSHPTPFNVSDEIKKRLKLKNAENMDFHAACSGSALMFAYLYENHKKYEGKNILLVAADKLSNTLIDLTRPDAMMLDSSLGQTIFGDGAAAIRFHYGHDIILHYALNKPLPDPGGKRDLIFMATGKNRFVKPCIVNPVAAHAPHRDFSNGYFSQNGPKVFEIVQKYMPSIIRETVAKSKFKPEDIDLAIVHPGSKRVVDALADRLHPDFKVFSEYADGNMSSVSLLYSFIKAIEKKLIGRGSRVVLCGFGAGSPDLYSSTVVIELK